MTEISGSKNARIPIRLPGDPSEKERIASMIRVDHAGEYGAVRIYEGQRAVLKHSKHADVIAHMAEQEKVHLDFFSREMAARKVRPTVLLPLWHVAGFAMGVMTALLGEKAAMACTVAVEEVIDQHYQEQLVSLPEGEKPLAESIEKFRQEEVEHRDIGVANQAYEAPAYPLLSMAIQMASRVAIFLSKRV